jgi:hypothetical protein
MEAVLSLLDPSGDFINGCRYSRDDETSQEDPRKDPSCLHIPHQTHIVILDDSPHVWPSAYTALTVLPASRYDFIERFANHLRQDKRKHFPSDSDNFLKEDGLHAVIQAVHRGQPFPQPNSSSHQVKYRDSFRSVSTTDNSPTASDASWASAASAAPKTGWFDRLTSFLFSLR